MKTHNFYYRIQMREECRNLEWYFDTTYGNQGQMDSI